MSDHTNNAGLLLRLFGLLVYVLRYIARIWCDSCVIVLASSPPRSDSDIDSVDSELLSTQFSPPLLTLSFSGQRPSIHPAHTYLHLFIINPTFSSRSEATTRGGQFIVPHSWLRLWYPIVAILSIIPPPLLASHNGHRSRCYARPVFCRCTLLLRPTQ
jgi:hypothetical protein